MNNITSTNLLDFPKELLKHFILERLETFNDLSNAAATCQLFSQCVHENQEYVDEKVSRTISYLPYTTDDDRLYVDKFLETFTSDAKKLELKYCGSYFSDWMSANYEKLSSIETLRLPDSNIGPEEVKVIAPLIEENPHLTTIDLSNNKIGDDGAIALAQAITKCPNLQVLNLKKCNIGPKGLKAIATALKGKTTLEELNLSEWGYAFDCTPEFVNEFFKILAKALKDCHNLKRLTLCNIKAHLDDNMIPIFQALHDKRHLIEFNIQCGIFSEIVNIDAENELVTFIKTTKSLEKLNIGNHRLNAETVVAIIKHLKIHSQLKYFNISRCPMGDIEFTKVINELNEIKTLEILDLSYSTIGSGGAGAIANMLETNTSIKKLNLDMVSCSADDLTLILNAIKDFNRSLEHLKLFENFEESQTAIAVANIFSKNRTLKSLDFGGSVGIKGLTALKNILETHTPPLEKFIFTELHSPSNPIDSAKFKRANAELISSLNAILTLKYLDLNQRDHLNHDEVMALANLISNSKCLEHLNLCNIDLNTDKLDILTSAINENSTLTYLALDLKNFTNMELQDIAIVLGSHPSLKHLDLQICEEEEISVIKTFLKTFKENRYLEKLGFPFYCYDNPEITTLLNETELNQIKFTTF